MNQEQEARRTRKCSYCGRRLMVPCDNPGAAETCGRRERVTQAYEIANTVGHPHRLEYTLPIMRYHQHLDMALLNHDLITLQNSLNHG